MPLLATKDRLPLGFESPSIPEGVIDAKASEGIYEEPKHSPKTDTQHRNPRARVSSLSRSCCVDWRRHAAPLASSLGLPVSSRTRGPGCRRRISEIDTGLQGRDPDSECGTSCFRGRRCPTGDGATTVSAREDRAESCAPATSIPGAGSVQGHKFAVKINLCKDDCHARRDGRTNHGHSEEFGCSKCKSGQVNERPE